MAPRLAFLGLGSMGEAISSNLVKSGILTDPLLLWNRTYEKAKLHATNIENARAMPAIEDAVKGADLIWSCLATEAAVLEVYSTILATNLEGKLFIECSTISPKATNELAQQITNTGAEFVAMPVFGEPSMARRAVLTCIPAGEASSVSRVLPYVKGVIGKSVINLGGHLPGTAAQLKLVGNVLIVQMIESVAEAHHLADQIGLSARNVHEMIDSVWSGPFTIYSERMVSGDYYRKEPIVDVQMARHVAEHVLELAASCEASLPAYQLGVNHLQGVERYAGKNKDISGIYGVLRQASGLQYES